MGGALERLGLSVHPAIVDLRVGNWGSANKEAALVSIEGFYKVI